jgi:predicted small lipoprotein YifL
MTRTRSQLLFFLAIAALLFLSGCAYKGDVFLYSPQGAGNVIEKAVSTDAEFNVPLIP